MDKIKPLSEMSLEELWQLFPIILKEHNPEYKNWYAEKKKEILSSLDSNKIFRINHIGSSAVEGLLSKPTIDILLEINRNYSPQEIIDVLENNNWILMSEQSEPYFNLSFNQGYTPKGFAERVFHLHVRYADDWDELYFRDFLCERADVCAEYAKLKLDLMKKFKHNRDGYTEAKTEFIKKYSAKAKQLFESKYHQIKKR